MHRLAFLLIATKLLFVTRVLTISLNVDDQQSIKSAAKRLASGILDDFTAQDHSGVFFNQSSIIAWTQSSLVWDSLINYWALTGDDSYVHLTAAALNAQAGPDNNFFPPTLSNKIHRQSKYNSIGNDDQSYWALATMTAAETLLPPVSGQKATWVELAQNVFDIQASLWETSTCAGGLRWQLQPTNFGYNYKDSFSNANFIELAARLARYTGNATYSDWALRAIEWMARIEVFKDSTGAVFDSALVNTNCSQVVQLQWTGDTGSLLSGTAYMANATHSAPWTHINRVILNNASSTFAANGTITEVVCANHQFNCTGQYTSLRAIFARSLARSRDLLGVDRTRISMILRASASAAAQSCTVSGNRTRCTGEDADFISLGNVGRLGQIVSALELVLALLESPELHMAQGRTTDL